MSNIWLYILSGIIFALCIVPCVDVSGRFVKSQNKRRWRTFVYAAGVYIGMSFWTCLMGLLLYMTDQIYRSGLLFISLFVLISGICIIIGDVIDATKIMNAVKIEKRQKIRRILISVLTAIIWIAGHVVFNYFMNIILSAAFFMSNNTTEIYLFYIALFAIGAFIIFASEIIINPDDKVFSLRLPKLKKKQKETVYVPKAARNMINHKKKKKKRR